AEPAPTDTAQGAAPSPLVQGIGRQLKSATRYVFPFLTSTLAAIAGIIVMLFLAIYVAVDPGLYRRGFLVMVPPESRGIASRVLSQMAVKLRRWLVTQLIAMVVIGVVSTVVLLILGVKAPFALGLLAGLLEFVPTIGPVLTILAQAVMAMLFGFLGLMVAVPLLAAIMVPLRILYVERERPLTEAQLEASG